MIPRLLYRTVPAVTDAQTDAWWDGSVALTPGWEHVTYRDPLDPADWPLTSPHWDECTSGAQFAGLIRLEAAIKHGGWYLDGDAELVRSPERYLSVHGLAGWEDTNTAPDAIFAFERGHPALPILLEDAIRNLSNGAWESGPGVFTRLLPGRSDVLLVPPAVLYPYHWAPREKRRYGPDTAQGRQNFARLIERSPWTVAAHHWRASWTGRKGSA